MDTNHLPGTKHHMYCILCLLYGISSQPIGASTGTHSSNKDHQTTHDVKSAFFKITPSKEKSLYFTSLLISRYSTAANLKLNRDELRRLLVDIGLQQGNSTPSADGYMDGQDDRDMSVEKESTSSNTSQKLPGETSTRHNHPVKGDKISMTETDGVLGKECLNMEDMLKIHNMGHKTRISQRDLMFLAPVLLYQLTEGCHRQRLGYHHDNSMGNNPDHQTDVDDNHGNHDYDNVDSENHEGGHNHRNDEANLGKEHIDKSHHVRDHKHTAHDADNNVHDHDEHKNDQEPELVINEPNDHGHGHARDRDRGHEHEHDRDHRHEHKHKHDHSHEHEQDYDHDHDKTSHQENDDNLHTTHARHNRNEKQDPDNHYHDNSFCHHGNHHHDDNKNSEPDHEDHNNRDHDHHDHHGSGHDGYRDDHNNSLGSMQQHFSNIPLTVWGYSFLAVLVISLVGLVSVAIIPLMTRVFYHALIHFLVAMAIGALMGDALLHLLPHALSSESHADHGDTHGHHDNHSSNHSDHQSGHGDAVWKGMCSMAGIVVFFIMERLLTIVSERNVKKKTQTKEHIVPTPRPSVGDGPIVVGVKLSAHDEPDYQDCETTIFNGNGHAGKMRDLDNSYCKESLLPVVAVKPSDAGESFNSPEDATRTYDDHAHSHGGHGHSHLTDELPNSVTAIAWMVIVGDGAHNLSDGLALGAAFSNSITGGISTSIAIFCHELPHEIGDFAVLLQAGMTVKQALIYNCVSSVLCLVGMVIGVAIGNIAEVSLWIFAGVAGMFIYIALVDMVPELLKTQGKGVENGLCRLFLHLLGMAVGVSIMACIAVYEHRLMNIVDL